MLISHISRLITIIIIIIIIHPEDRSKDGSWDRPRREGQICRKKGVPNQRAVFRRPGNGRRALVKVIRVLPALPIHPVAATVIVSLAVVMENANHSILAPKRRSEKVPRIIRFGQG
uniref:Putative secreted peptide n=1 Tax=Anopheles braziliensis TaxID=58242 RepID=A0A2M3ZMX5_9DIPT